VKEECLLFSNPDGQESGVEDARANGECRQAESQGQRSQFDDDDGVVWMANESIGPGRDDLRALCDPAADVPPAAQAEQRPVTNGLHGEEGDEPGAPEAAAAPSRS